MFRILLGLAVALSSGISGSIAYAGSDPVLIPTKYTAVYIPGGFSSHNQVQIVGEGMFVNSCYRSAPTTVKVDDATHRVLIGPAAYEYGGFCLQVVLPFDKVIDVGILSPGMWHVIQESDGADLGVIPVKRALTSGPDDYLYAPITQAFFQQDGLSGKVLLTGNYPNSCMVLDHVQITKEPKVIVVQPFAKMLTRSDCKDGSYPFTASAAIDIIPQGRYLLHVRSMNDKAINTLIDVNPPTEMIP